MYCLNPIKSYAIFNDKGYIDQQLRFSIFSKEECDKRGIPYYPESSYIPLDIGCNRCVFCQHKRKLQLSLLMNMELLTTKTDSCFITLTYDNDHLPKIGGLNYLDFAKFMKSMKQFYRRRGVKRFSYVFSGEYGNKTLRPHFHCCCFGVCPNDFQDTLKWITNHHSSDIVNRLWHRGFNTCDKCNNITCAYTAGYTEKKLILVDQDYLNKCFKLKKKRKEEAIEKGYNIYSNSYRNRILYTKEQLKQQKKLSDLDKYITIEDQIYFRPDYPCGSVSCDFNGEYIQAEKVRSSGGLGFKFFETYKEDFFKGYVVDPMNTKRLFTIPNKFLQRLKNENFDKYEKIKIASSNFIQDLSEIDIHNKQNQLLLQLKARSVHKRSLDFEPLDNDTISDLENIF